MATMAADSGGEGKTPTTAPPPFDPEQYARDSELALRASSTRSTATPTSELRSTAELPSAPPLNKRVRVAVPVSDLAWFDLSEAALAMAARIDGTKTLAELIDGASELEVIAQLHEAGVLQYDE